MSAPCVTSRGSRSRTVTCSCRTRVHRRHGGLRAQSADRLDAGQGSRLRRVACRAASEHPAPQGGCGTAARLETGRVQPDRRDVVSEGDMRLLLEHRVVVSLALSASARRVRAASVWPFPGDDAVPALIRGVAPDVLSRRWSTSMRRCGLRTPCLVLNVVSSLIYILVVAASNRHADRARVTAVSGSADASRICSWCSVSSITAPSPRRAPNPRWLVIPERGLYTGMAIVGAIGTGKTSACMYPYVEQLLAYRAERCRRARSAASILDVKGDFCRHVQRILERHGRAEDYVEVESRRRRTATTRCTTISMPTPWRSASPR